ncbi:hypothetical protein Vadar_007679 [Vaccinium darrowii]|uniref:Uncharacterized protein n=1 Tax=Vaccinium darrowii TaxID=229202 RepID=A0ACB7YEE2_9ERIC|nr:hypothetical protein Vadar_007679 [Vaccinium darrowii]
MRWCVARKLCNRKPTLQERRGVESSSEAWSVISSIATGASESSIYGCSSGIGLVLSSFGFSTLGVSLAMKLKEGQDGRLQTEKRRCSLVGPVADKATKARKGFCANVAQDETTHDGQHAMDLVRLPRGPEVSIAAEAMAKQSQEVVDYVRQKLAETNAKNKAAADKGRRVKLFNVSDEISNVFNVADIFEYHEEESLYPDLNSRSSSFEEPGIGPNLMG